MKVQATGSAFVGALLALGGCSAESLREDQCVDSAAEYQMAACLSNARDPKWDYEERWREQVDKARTTTEKRKKECAGLSEEEATKCMLSIPEEQR